MATTIFEQSLLTETDVLLLTKDPESPTSPTVSTEKIVFMLSVAGVLAIILFVFCASYIYHTAKARKKYVIDRKAATRVAVKCKKTDNDEGGAVSFSNALCREPKIKPLSQSDNSKLKLSGVTIDDTSSDCFMTTDNNNAPNKRYSSVDGNSYDNLEFSTGDETLCEPMGVAMETTDGGLERSKNLAWLRESINALPDIVTSDPQTIDILRPMCDQHERGDTSPVAVKGNFEKDSHRQQTGTDLQWRNGSNANEDRRKMTKDCESLGIENPLALACLDAVDISLVDGVPLIKDLQDRAISNCAGHINIPISDA